jgi:hypothetical protein
MVPSSLGAAYRRFWHEVGERFPDLGGAASTAYYLENEKRLLIPESVLKFRYGIVL